MEKMEKICPTCGKKCPTNINFCLGCGSSLQAVAPTQTQTAAAFSQAASIFSGAAGSFSKKASGFSFNKPFKVFVPLVLAILNFIFFLGYPTVRYENNSDPLLNGTSFADMCNFEYIEELEFWGAIIVIFFILGTLLSFAGAVLRVLEKPIGNFVLIGGSVFTILQQVITFISFAVETDGRYIPTFTGFVIIFISIAIIALSVIAFFKSLPKKTVQAPVYQNSAYQQPQAPVQNPEYQQGYESYSNYINYQ